MKANVLFFDKKPAAEKPWTQSLWVYDYRTNVHFTLKQNQLRRADLDDFVTSYPPMVPADTSDMLVTLVTLDAEDAFDVQADLSRVTAPTLVLGGSKDFAYPPEMFRDTAAGVNDGPVHIFPGWGHGRASSSSATAHLTLGFMLAGTRIRS